MTANASSASPTGASKSGTLSLGISKALPWGLHLSAQEQTTYKDAKWVLNESSANPTIGSYDRPWSSSLSASASFPVFGGKGYGEYAERDVAVKLASMEEKHSRANFQSQTNDLLHKVQRAYWSLVGAVRTLDVTIENRRMVGKMVAKTRKQYDLQLKTSYAMAQIDAEYERVNSQGITAWKRYILASNELNHLLDFEQSVLLLPVGYGASMSHFAGKVLAEALVVGQKQNPTIKAKKIKISQADLNIKKSENQTRPDLQFSVSTSASQSSAVFGYESLGESLANLADPDMVRVAAGAAYNYPWLNQLHKARLEQARTRHSVSGLQQRVTHNQVARKIKNAHVALDSALIRITMTERRVQLTRLSYEKAGRLHALDRVAEYEMIVKSGDVLRAEKQLILAWVDAKKAESDLLSAMGVLGQDERLSKEQSP